MAKYIFIGVLAITLFFSCTPEQSLLNHHASRPVIYRLKPDSSYSSRSSTYSSEEINYFLEVALGSEYGVGDFAVRKWTRDLKIEISGQPTPEDLQTVRKVIDDLNSLIGPRIRLEIVPSNGNVLVYFIPESEFYHYEPPGIVYFGGFFWNWWDYAGEIYQGRVVIAADRITQQQRSHLIREELTQVLGLMNDSVKYQNSIFYQQYSEVQQYSALDRAVIKMLYNDNILPGMTDFEIQELLLKKDRKFRH